MPSTHLPEGQDPPGLAAREKCRSAARKSNPVLGHGQAIPITSAARRMFCALLARSNFRRPGCLFIALPLPAPSAACNSPALDHPQGPMLARLTALAILKPCKQDISAYGHRR